ncbi:hypothetical protein [Sphingobium xenophagum]|uniref:hypothetical protein n=1 Tax=Sphingobium xenophagum TaxID=121428 RepID=UPI00286CC5F7|nr:hypothetical protein [Sphingobium xenophagum]
MALLSSAALSPVPWRGNGGEARAKKRGSAALRRSILARLRCPRADDQLIEAQFILRTGGTLPTKPIQIPRQ